MDFVSDKLFDGRSFRILTVVDVHTREALSTAARTNFRAYQVVDELDRLASPEVPSLANSAMTRKPLVVSRVVV